MQDPLPGRSTAEGKRPTPAQARLPELIEANNQRFGIGLGEADAVLIDHPVAVLPAD